MGGSIGRVAYVDGTAERQAVHAPARGMLASADAAPFTINGRFLDQPLTGVQRYGREVVASLDRLLRQNGRHATLAVPAGTSDGLTLGAISTRPVGMGSGHAWEQTMLPWCRDALLNLCNTGPAVVRRQAVCVHDTNVFTEPGSYRPAFRLFYRALQPRLARRAAAIATVSRSAAAAIAGQFGIPVGHIAVLPNGHEHALRWRADRAGIAAQLPVRPFVLLLGSRARHKNTGLLVSLADALNDRGLDLVVTGGTASIFAQEDAASAGPANLHRLGRVCDDDLALLFRRALCLAFPSLTEGFGLPILEAMVHGCPVIASDRASMPEVCGSAALLARPDDPVAWLSHITALRDSAGLCRELRERGRAQARRFSWDDTARGYLQLMDAIA